MTLPRLARAVDTGLWLVPLVCVLAGVGLSFATIEIDRTAADLVPSILTGGPSEAQNILATIATAMVTLLTLVLTVTTVAIQLAMGQFSPRIVGSLLRDRPNQLAIGLFGATFVYALLALRAVEVPAGSGEGSVPGLTVVVAMVLMLASVVTLILYVHHSGRALRATGLIDLVGDDLHAQLDRRYPPPDVDAPDPALLAAREAGVVTNVDEAGLVAAARAGDCVLELVPAMGDFVPAGGPLLRVRGGAPERLDRARAMRLVTLGPERTHDDDPAYGFRCLVDIAERALAEPFDDPSTAVQAIDRLHECLHQLAPRPFPSGRFCDEDGRLRLVTRTIDWGGYVRLAFDEIRLAGAGSPQVTRRLAAALEDLERVAPADRQAPLEHQRRLLRAGAERAYDDLEDVEGALAPDAQGIGSGEDLLADGRAATPSPASGDGRVVPVGGGSGGRASGD